MIDTLRETPINCNRISASFDQIKAVGAAKLTAAAKYIAVLMLTTGERSAAQLRLLSGLGKTTVYRAQAEIFESEVAHLFEGSPASPESSTSPAIPADGNKASPESPAYGKIREKSVPQFPPAGLLEPEPSCARDITTRATKELPSEVVILENNIPPLAPPTPKTAKPKSEKCGTRLPDDFELPEDWRQWALVNCPLSSPDRVELEGRKFANHWQASSGQNARKRSWYKAWQNWCYRAFASAPIRPRAQAPSWQEERNQKARLIMELASKPREIDLVQ